MTRALACAVLALFVGLAPLSPATAGATKVCKFKLSTGKVKSWTCGKDQPCCASETFGLYTCGSQLLQCF